MIDIVIRISRGSNIKVFIYLKMIIIRTYQISWHPGTGKNENELSCRYWSAGKNTLAMLRTGFHEIVH